MFSCNHGHTTIDIIMNTDHTHPTISAADFKAHCLALMDEVKNKKQTFVITKHGVPVAKLVAIDETPPSLYLAG